MPVLADGGIRSGTAVLKMLALGASAVLVGRPFCIAAMGGGKDGVVSCVRELHASLEAAMVLTGCPDAESAGGWLLA
jgi:isopentenyl diphosphate isomerase/L-lactate dehydrogenase-like FMN-dependent dehydrogenase